MSEEKLHGGEQERLEQVRNLTNQLEEKDGQLYVLDSDSPDYERRRDYIQAEIDELKTQLFEVSTDQERVRLIEEALPDHEIMHEISDGEYTVTVETILNGAFAIDPTKAKLSPYLVSEINRIKEENPWIDSSEE